ncbi:hypothetical protein V2G26_002228 [Clonostachys chloroleuca]
MILLARSFACIDTVRNFRLIEKSLHFGPFVVVAITGDAFSAYRGPQSISTATRRHGDRWRVNVYEGLTDNALESSSIRFNNPQTKSRGYGMTLWLLISDIQIAEAGSSSFCVIWRNTSGSQSSSLHLSEMASSSRGSHSRAF